MGLGNWWVGGALILGVGGGTGAGGLTVPQSKLLNIL